MSLTPIAVADAAASHGSQFVSRVKIALASCGNTLRWRRDRGGAATTTPTSLPLPPMQNDDGA